jgi:hypothetical protein
MSKLQRFYLNNDRYVVDRLDWSNNGLAWIPEGLPDAIEDMRRDVFWKRFDPLLECLLSPYVRKKYYGVYKLQRYEDAERAILNIAAAIGESQADHATEQAQLPVRRTEIGTPVERIADITSVGLFISDLGSLFRSIYGNCGKEFSTRFRDAVVAVLKLAMKGRLKHLWREYHDACIVDGDLRIPGYPHKSDTIDEARAFDRILARVQKVRENPTRFGKYTIEFVKRLEPNLSQELQYSKPRSTKRKKASGCRPETKPERYTVEEDCFTEL